jgi:hypothetical protein
LENARSTVMITSAIIILLKILKTNINFTWSKPVSRPGYARVYFALSVKVE